MIRLARPRLSYANVMATIAVLLATGGTATAAKALITGANVKNESLTGADVRNSSLTGVDVRNGSLSGADLKTGSLSASHFAANQLPAGRDGKDGAPGKDGTPGKDGAPGADGARGPAGPDLSGATFVRVPADGSATANATDVREALADISDASATKPYVLSLSPGRYDLGATTLTLKPYVSIVGAGPQFTTLTASNLPATTVSPVLRPANGSHIAQLYLDLPNLGNTYAYAVYPLGGSTSSITDVDISMSGSTNFSSFGLQTHSAAGAPATLYVDRTDIVMQGTANTALEISGGGTLVMRHSSITTAGSSIGGAYGSTIRLSYSSISGNVGNFGGTLRCAYLTDEDSIPFSSATSCG